MSLSNLERAFIDRVTISRLIKTADTFGGFSTTTNILYKDIPVRLYADAGDLERDVSGQTLRASMKMMVSPTTDIIVGDIITAQDGNQYIVIWIRNYRVLSQDHHKTVELATYSETKI